MDLKDGWIKKLILNGFKSIHFHKHVVLVLYFVFRRRKLEFGTIFVFNMTVDVVSLSTL
jgi:hypothetical protein